MFLAVYPAPFVLKDDLFFRVKLDANSLAMSSSFVPKSFVNFSVALVECAEAMWNIVSPLTFVGSSIDSPGHLAFAVFQVAYPLSLVDVSSLAVYPWLPNLPELDCLRL